MAFLDQMGSFFNIGGESEEERRRREEEERLKAEQTPTPFKQTIVTDPVTGKQTMKMEGDVRDFTAANPNTPTVTGPAVPGQAPESTQPQQPGFFGELYRTKMDDLNKRVDQTMGLINDPEAYARQRLGMQPSAPVAPATIPPTAEAIEAGPPTSAMMPTAETAPVKSKAQLEAERLRAPTTAPTTASAVPGVEMGPPTSAMTDTAWADRFVSAQKDPNQMASLQADPNQPEWVRRLAAEQNYNAVKQQKDEKLAEQKVQQAVQSGNMIPLAREIQKAGGEGSVLKAYLYSRFGLNDLAKQEQEKLGAGLRWETSVDSKGNAALIQYSGSGLPMKGYDPTGKELTTEQLAGYGSQGALLKGAQAGSQLYIDPVTKQSLSKVDTLRGPIYYNTKGERVIPQGQPYPLNTGSNIDLQQQLQIQKIRNQLEGTKAENRIKTLEGLNAIRIKEGQPPFGLADVGLDANGNFTTRGAVTQAQVQTTPAATPAPAPAATTTAPTTVTPVAPTAVKPTAVATPTTTATPTTGVAQPGSTTGAIERSAEAQKDIVKAAGDVVKNQANIVKDLGDAQRTVKILESGKTNFGTIIGGTIPGERAVGKLFNTEDAIRTKNVLEYVNKIASSNVKALGANPTDRDLIFVTSNIPDETWNEKDVANWIKRSEKGLRNSIRIAREQIRTGGAYEEPLPPETPEGEVDTNNPLLKKKKK